MKNHDNQMYTIIENKEIKNLEQNKQLSKKEINRNFDNLVNLVGKWKLPKLRTCSNYFF
jgi:hypothetical protein